MAQLALGIFNRAMPFDKLVALSEQAGLPPPLMPWDTYDAFEKELGWRFWLSRREFLVSHLKRIGKVADRLADEESRATLLRICAFRLGLDLAFASQHSSDHQYFNALTLAPLIGKSIGYVDCGAYTGDTYVELTSQPGIHCKQAFLLEPDPANYAALSKNMAQRPEAICLPLAAAGEYTILSFASGQGEGGAIAAGGDIRIAAVALDQMLPDGDVHFIKLDVEGAEAQVLRGAAGLIRNHRPMLALSLYHNPQDLFELPELLFELCEDYRFYVRQHYCNTFDCVLYACPEVR
jgi:FkbM family methyltransferase